MVRKHFLNFIDSLTTTKRVFFIFLNLNLVEINTFTNYFKYTSLIKENCLKIKIGDFKSDHELIINFILATLTMDIGLNETYTNELRVYLKTIVMNINCNNFTQLSMALNNIKYKK